MRNMETPGKKSLGLIIGEIRSGHYVIPDFQREFDWAPWDVEDLLKSIFKDYYIGTLLLWWADKNNVEQLAAESIYGFEGKKDPLHIVLDGQQRLSALHYALFAPNKEYPNRKSRFLFFLDVDAFLDEDWENVVFYDNQTKKIEALIGDREIQYEKGVMPLSVFSDEKFEYHDWVSGYKKYWTDRNKDEIENICLDLKRGLRETLREYDVSYIELDRSIEIDKVCDIFAKINNTGVSLSIFDLLNALLKPKNIQLKQMWRNVKGEFLDILEAKSILTTMSIVRQTYCAPRFLYFLVPGAVRVVKSNNELKEDVILKDRKEFISLWEDIINSMRTALNIIKNPRDYGAIKNTFIPYPASLPIFAVLYREKIKLRLQRSMLLRRKYNNGIGILL